MTTMIRIARIRFQCAEEGTQYYQQASYECAAIRGSDTGSLHESVLTTPSQGAVA